MGATPCRFESGLGHQMVFPMRPDASCPRMVSLKFLETRLPYAPWWFPFNPVIVRMSLRVSKKRPKSNGLIVLDAPPPKWDQAE